MTDPTPTPDDLRDIARALDQKLQTVFMAHDRAEKIRWAADRIEQSDRTIAEYQKALDIAATEIEQKVAAHRVEARMAADRIAQLEAEVLTPSQRRQVLGAALSYDERLQGGIVPYDFPNVWQEATDE